jgi:peroxiredoxin Q/BCP
VSEARGFRDAIAEFNKLNVPVVGVSPDKPSAQLKFKEKYDLPFSLLCDTEREVAKAYGVISEKSLYGRLFMGVDRTTFVIDSSGKIKRIFPKVKVDGHAEQVLAALKE